MIVLAHGAGSPVTTPFFDAVRDGLLARGLTVVLFHFAYMQLMAEGASRRPPDPRPRLLAAWRAMLQKVAGWEGAGAVVIGGRSMGGRMASHVLAERGPELDAADVRGAVYLGFPLHPAKKPATDRAAHLGAIAVPQLFVSGTRDALARADLLAGVVSDLGDGARRLSIEGADHGLARGKAEPLADGPLWLDEIAAFAGQVAAP